MPFLFLSFLFPLLFSVIYANTITIEDKFSETNHICIYNSTNTDLTLKLKSNNNSNNQICIYFKDYTGTIDSKCDTGEVEIAPDSLRKKVIYYIADLGYQEDDDYNLTIEGDDDGILASECPSNNLAKVSNATPEGIANAMLIAGVLTAFLMFAGIIYSFIPPSIHKEDEEIG